MDAQAKPNRNLLDLNLLIVISLLLILTSAADAPLMFGVSATLLFSLCLWFFALRKIWLATLSVVVFLATVVFTGSELF